ncbi:hypothetical protein Ddc_02005 [Ditylenchus destructor]|nr:hypothetical protein Ddc_02005 [Ditylenchus destructor]
MLRSSVSGKERSLAWAGVSGIIFHYVEPTWTKTNEWTMDDAPLKNIIPGWLNCGRLCGEINFIFVLRSQSTAKRTLDLTGSALYTSKSRSTL